MHNETAKSWKISQFLLFMSSYDIVCLQWQKLRVLCSTYQDGCTHKYSLSISCAVVGQSTVFLFESWKLFFWYTVYLDLTPLKAALNFRPDFDWNCRKFLDILRLKHMIQFAGLNPADWTPCCVCVQWVCKGGVQPGDAAFKDSGRHPDSPKGLLHAAQLSRAQLFHHVWDHAERLHPSAHLRGGEVGAPDKHWAFEKL